MIAATFWSLGTVSHILGLGFPGQLLKYIFPFMVNSLFVIQDVFHVYSPMRSNLPMRDDLLIKQLEQIGPRDVEQIGRLGRGQLFIYRN